MKPLVLFFLLWFVSACSSSRDIQSYKTQGLSIRPKKIFFRFDAPRLTRNGATFMKRFETKLNAKLRAKGITVAYLPYDPLSLLSASDIQNQINQFKPDAVMVFSQTNDKFRLNVDEGYSLQLDAQLLSNDNQSVLWRGVFARSSSGLVGLERNASKMVNTLMGEMQVQGFITTQ